MTGRPGVAVTGGAYSISADFADLDRLADGLVALAEGLAEVTVGTLRGCAQSTFSDSAVLDPVGATEVAVQTALTLACLVAASAEAAALATALRSANQAYQAADDVRSWVQPVAAAARGLPAVASDVLSLPVSVLSGQPLRLQELLTDDPELVDLVVNGAALALTGGPLTGFVVPGGAEQLIAGAAAGLYSDGTPAVTSIPAAVNDDEAGAPRSVADLVRGLSVREGDDHEPATGGGMIDIRFVSHADGTRSVVVDLTGTTRWNLDPRQATPQASDFGTNLRALSGESSVYERGVREAIRLAGVGADEPIMLVGHSQGGLIAAQLASSLTRDGLQVTHLLTAGAPLGLAAIPGGIAVLALENRGDVVPELDGRANRAKPNLITATVGSGGGTVAQQHSVRSYLAGAAEVDASADATLSAWRRSAAAFLTGTSVTTLAYQVRRQ